MKKIILFSAFLFTASLSANTLFAQNAREEQVAYNKVQSNAFVAEYNLPKEVIQQTLNNYFSGSSFGKKSSSKGYSIYKQSTWEEISMDKLDIYVTVSGKKNNSKVTMLVSKGYDNFINSSNDATTSENVKRFLNNLKSQAAVVQQSNDIEAQKKLIEQAEKQQKSNESNYKKLVEKKKDVEQDIADAQKKLDLQTTDLQKLKDALNALENK